MTQFLPQNLLALFAPRDPIPFLPPTDKQPHEKLNCHTYAGVGAFLHEFEDPKDTPPPTRVETKDERKERKRKERAEQVAYKLEQDLALWAPTEDPAIIGDPFKTLFVARVNYDSSESKLRREFEVYGPVKQISVTYDRSGKPRGYAFIEYEHERDMHSAYKHADGKKIDGRRVLVDVERGRTVKGWRPRRLGGGLGGTRRGGPDMNSKYSGREDNHNRDRTRSRSPRSERAGGGADRPERRPRRSRSREQRPDRPERPDRPDRPERPDRPDRPDRSDRPDSRERPERPPRRRRSRSRDKKRRSKSRDRKDKDEERSKRRRSRSKDRAKRSRSRDRKRRRSRSRDRKSRRDRDRTEEDILNSDDIKQEKISGKTPPHEPSGNGFEPDENYPAAQGGGEEGQTEGEYGDVNGEPQAEQMDPQFATNEYGSTE